MRGQDAGPIKQRQDSFKKVLEVLVAMEDDELLLLQASDWPFVIHTRGAVDYGLRRILDHASRFDDLCNGVEDALAGQGPDPVVIEAVQRCRLLDPVFPDLDLAWWAG